MGKEESNNKRKVIIDKEEWISPSKRKKFKQTQLFNSTLNTSLSHSPPPAPIIPHKTKQTKINSFFSKSQSPQLPELPLTKKISSYFKKPIEVIVDVESEKSSLKSSTSSTDLQENLSQNEFEFDDLDLELLNDEEIELEIQREKEIERLLFEKELKSLNNVNDEHQEILINQTQTQSQQILEPMFKQMKSDILLELKPNNSEFEIQKKSFQQQEKQEQEEKEKEQKQEIQKDSTNLFDTETQIEFETEAEIQRELEIEAEIEKKIEEKSKYERTESQLTTQIESLPQNRQTQSQKGETDAETLLESFPLPENQTSLPLYQLMPSIPFDKSDTFQSPDFDQFESLRPQSSSSQKESLPISQILKQMPFASPHISTSLKNETLNFTQLDLDLSQTQYSSTQITPEKSQNPLNQELETLQFSEKPDFEFSATLPPYQTPSSQFTDNKTLELFSNSINQSLS